MGDLGITIPLDGPLPEHRALLPRLRDAGYGEFWSSETAGHDAFTPLAYAAAVLPEARFGTAIASVFTRGPALLAMSAAALAEAAPGRFTLGVGAASPVIVAQWNGIPYEQPLTRVRETVQFLREVLSGHRAANGFRLEAAPVPPPIVVAALRPAMLKLAGEVGDGAVLNWLSAQDVRRVVPYVHEGGPGKRIVARLFVCRSDDPATVRAAAKRLITGYLTVPGYAAFHRWLGRGERLGDMWAAWERGDRRGALAAVDDAVVDELIVHGTAEECANHIRRYVEAGVQLPVLKFLPLDPTRDLRADAVEVAEAYVPPPAKSWS